MTQVYVSELTLSDCLTFRQDTSADVILNAMREAQTTESYILKEDGDLYGKLDLHTLIANGVDFEEKLDFSPTSLSMSNSLVEALGIASDFVGESIPVLEEGSFIGAITEGDLFTEVLNIEESLREEETVR